MKIRVSAAIGLVAVAALVAVVSGCSSEEPKRKPTFPSGGPKARIASVTSGPTKAQGRVLAQLEKSTGSRVMAAVHPRERTVTSLYLNRAEPNPVKADAAKRFVVEQRELFGEGVDELGEPIVDEAEGWSDVSFERRHRGVRIHGDRIAVGFDPKGALRLVGGRLSQGIADLDVVPNIERDVAITTARALANSEARGVLLESESPIVELVILPSEGVKQPPRLAWRVRLALDPDQSPSAYIEYRIDAKTGVAFYAENGVHGIAPTVVTATDLMGWSHQLRVLDASLPLLPSFSAADTTRKHRTESCGKVYCSVYTTSDRAQWDPGIVSAHQNFAIAYDTYKEVFGQAGGPGGRNGTIVSQYEFAGPLPFMAGNEGNAYWTAGLISGGYIRYGKKAGGMDHSYAADTAVVGHEYTHGVIEYTSKLVYARESGALNESIADVMGIYIKNHAADVGYIPTAFGEWRIGDFAGTGRDPLRNLSNPESKGQPSAYRNIKYGGNCAPADNNDQCGVHTNSGISNFAFYLAAHGGTSPVTGRRVPAGIGWSAAQIWYRAALHPKAAMRTLKSEAPQMEDFAIATIAASDALNGGDSQVSHRVHCAWNAVDIMPYGHDVCSLCNGDSLSSRSLRPRDATLDATCDRTSDALVPGRSACGVAGAGDDGAQWRTIEANANEPVTFHLDGMTSDLDLEVYDASGDLIASSNADGLNPEIASVLLDEPANLYVRVVSPSGDDSPFDLVADNPWGPNKKDAFEAASCSDTEGDEPQTVPSTPAPTPAPQGPPPNCAIDGPDCLAGEICTNWGDGYCCKKEMAITQVCSGDSDCKADEVCAMAANEPIDGAFFTCTKRGTDACIRR